MGQTIIPGVGGGQPGRFPGEADLSQRQSEQERAAQDRGAHVGPTVLKVRLEKPQKTTLHTQEKLWSEILKGLQSPLGDRERWLVGPTPAVACAALCVEQKSGVSTREGRSRRQGEAGRVPRSCCCGRREGQTGCRWKTEAQGPR